MNLKIKSKKGDGINVLHFVFYFMLWGVFMLYMIFAMYGQLVKVYSNSYDAEHSLLYERAFYSPNGIIYVDPITNRAYPGIIDLDKITDEHLTALYASPTDSVFAMKVGFVDDNIPKEAIFNKELFEVGQPISQIKESKFSMLGDESGQKQYLLLKTNKGVEPITLYTESVFLRND